ncbi:hypothetical protein BDP27DRAFT_1446682 [Rhodocollybia butyracea]|uniref:Uncharacterized protein n=1 Tax=Rhodocollybia butyracea TaxID=206335 RepID=A0A9P5PZ17_9AGAR|nr:hypothetical protein BDP27DRAFT_1446682 [Rhodocollybia butyracea]
MAKAPTPSNIYFVEVESIASSVGGVLYGMYSVMAVLALASLVFQRSKASRGTIFLIAVITTMLLFETLNTIASTFLMASDIRSFSASSYPKATTAVIIVDLVVSKLNFFLNDLVIVWRAWSIVEPRPRWVQAVLVFCVFLSFGAVLVDIILATDSTLAGPNLNYTTARVVMPLSLLVTNIVATAIIGLRTWNFCTALKYIGEDAGGRVRHLTEVLMLLVETGCIYSLILILVVLDITLDAFSTEARYMLTSIIPHVTCIYPCLMVLIIMFKKRSYDAKYQEHPTAVWSISPQMSFMT